MQVANTDTLTRRIYLSSTENVYLRAKLRGYLFWVLYSCRRDDVSKDYPESAICQNLNMSE